MFPVVNKFFNVFDQNKAFLNQAKTVELPKLARKMEDFKGGGMDGDIQIDIGQEKMECTITYVGKLDAASDWATNTHDGVYRRITAAYENDDSGAIDAVEWEIRGRIPEIDEGNLEKGKMNEEKEKIAVSYYRKRVNGVTIVEIDIVNMVCFANGVDRMAAFRNAIQ